MLQNLFNKSENENIIQPGSSFEGSINTEGSVVVFGEIVATTVKADKLYIKPDARVKGNLEVNNLVVDGIFTGDVKAESRVILSSSAKVSGNVTTRELISTNGVEFQGNCKVSSENVHDIGKRIQELYSQKNKAE